MALAAVGLGVAIAGLGYGIYSSQEAASQSRAQFNAAQQRADQQEKEQQAMLQQQQAQQQQLAQQQQTEQQSNVQAQQTAQQTALANAQAQIPVNQAALAQSLQQQNQLALTQQEPILEGRLNQLGLLQSGALPQAQAQYQAQLGEQAQAALANYGLNANQALQNQALSYTGTDTANLQQNLMQTLANQQAAQNSQFANQGQAYANNVAQQQYLANLQAAQTAQQQAAANSYINFAGGLGGGLLSYAGRTQSPASNQNLGQYFQSPSNPGTYWNPNTGASFNTSGAGDYFTSPSVNYTALNSYNNGFYAPQAVGPLNYNPGVA